MWAKRIVENLTGRSVWREITWPAPRTGIVLTTTWTNVREDVSPLLLRHLDESLIHPRSMFDPHRGGQGGWPNGKLILKDGSTLLFLVSEGKQVNRAGFGAHFAGINEPPPPNLYNEIVRSVAATGGELIMNAAMVGRDVRWLEELVAGIPEEGIAPQSGWHEVVIPLSLENAPWRTPADIQLQKDSCLAAEYAQRIEASWRGVAVDRYIDAFDDSAISTNIPDRDWDVYVYIDWGESYRLYVGLGVGDDTQVWAIDEWVPKESTPVSYVAVEIKRMLSRHGLTLRDVTQVVGDTNAAELGYSLKMNDILSAELGYLVRNAKKGPASVRYHAKLMNSALRLKRFWVHPRCKQLVNTLRYWQGPSHGDIKHPFDATSYGLREAFERIHGDRHLELLRIP